MTTETLTSTTTTTTRATTTASVTSADTVAVTATGLVVSSRPTHGERIESGMWESRPTHTMSRDSQVWPTAQRSGRCPVEVRRFKSCSLHFSGS